jgi:LacI family transcriptional regulator
VAEALPDHTPFVALHPNTQAHNIVSLESNEETGSYEMVRCLASLGHKRIMHLSGRKGLVGAERRIEGYKRALRDSGLAFDPDLLVEAHFSVPHARLALDSWLSKHSEALLPDAIFGGSDSIAVGALEALSARGLRVPEDVSVCGFDDALAARTTVPQLATVRQPLRLMGSKAVDILLERIRVHHAHSHGEHELIAPVVFNTEIVLRGSIGPPARR